MFPRWQLNCSVHIKDSLINYEQIEKTYFNALSTDVKTELTWNCGKMVTMVETKDLYLSLFRLDHYFIEVHINKANSQLIDIALQEDRDILSAYFNNL